MDPLSLAATAVGLASVLYQTANKIRWSKVVQSARTEKELNEIAEAVTRVISLLKIVRERQFSPNYRVDSPAAILLAQTLERSHGAFERVEVLLESRPEEASKKRRISIKAAWAVHSRQKIKESLTELNDLVDTLGRLLIHEDLFHATQQATRVRDTQRVEEGLSKDSQPKGGPSTLSSDARRVSEPFFQGVGRLSHSSARLYVIRRGHHRTHISSPGPDELSDIEIATPGHLYQQLPAAKVVAQVGTSDEDDSFSSSPIGEGVVGTPDEAPTRSESSELPTNRPLEGDKPDQNTVDTGPSDVVLEQKATRNDQDIASLRQVALSRPDVQEASARKAESSPDSSAHSTVATETIAATTLSSAESLDVHAASQTAMPRPSHKEIDSLRPWHCYCPHVYICVGFFGASSLVFGIAWYFIKDDINGFNVSAYLVALGTLLAVILGVTHSEKCLEQRSEARQDRDVMRAEEGIALHNMLSSRVHSQGQS